MAWDAIPRASLAKGENVLTSDRQEMYNLNCGMTGLRRKDYGRRNCQTAHPS